MIIATYIGRSYAAVIVIVTVIMCAIQTTIVFITIDWLLLSLRKYSNKGKSDQETYTYTHEIKDGSKISFITIDACPNPGPRRPFNFFGIIEQVRVERFILLQQMLVLEGVDVIYFMLISG